MELVNYLQKKNELDAKRESLARLQGKLSATLQRLQDEWPVPKDGPIIEMAEQLLEQLRENLSNVEAEYNEKLSSFDVTYHEKLN